nr:hypothetical protein JCM19045_4423 [Bacillus sp. JCM 19045]GAF19949.1 hypothetical protein JCM19046_4644 [Bacillus sp. JCM 19046]
MEQAIEYDLFNQQFLHALKTMATEQPSEDQEMAASVLHLLKQQPGSIHLIDRDYKEATMMEFAQITNQTTNRTK